MIDAIDALDRAFAAGFPELPVRTVHPIDTGQLLLMPAWSDLGIGVKLITYSPDNAAQTLPTVQGVYVLFEPQSARPVAMLDGSAITELRTAAVSAVATRHLSPPAASRLRLYGTGVQGRSHVRAMQAVRPIEVIHIVSGHQENAVALASQLRGEGFDAFAVDPDGLIDADIICLTTTSPAPVIRASQLPTDVHINAIGAFQPHTRETDTQTVVSSSVYVEDRAAAMDEAGDLIIPEADGAWSRMEITADLHEVTSGFAPPRSGRTLFKGVGLPYEDLVIAAAAFRASV
ncbi:MAG: ornithine cyclodeaminase family protein [Acidimicrobiia bacterium]|nr:ornithine cyclodeaminase family protein [Acidimicrobiia bacterium]